MRSIAAAGLLLLTGCAGEYGLSGHQDGFGAANPSVDGTARHTDRLLQVVEPVVDVLWVIDNSSSMRDDRRALARAFPHFLEPFEASGVDWHIGVITTDMTDETQQGQLQARRGHKWLQPDTPAASVLFDEMVTDGLGHGDPRERGREAAWTALELESEGYNAGFLRDTPSGWLHVNVLSDEDDNTDDQVISTGRFAELIDWMRPQSSRTTFNSIVALEDDGCEERGESYIELTSLMGGQVHDLNEADWQSWMIDLGGLQAPRALDEFFLSQVPVPSTLEVHEVLTSGVTVVYQQHRDWEWDPERNSVRFLTEPPALGSAVELHYELATTR